MPRVITRHMRVATVMLAALIFSILTMTAQVRSQTVSFAGKTIEMYIAAGSGGGTDTSSRLIGDVIVKYLPGQPSVIYRNLPGGQGVKALNYVVARVKPDGIGIVGGSQAHIDPGTKKSMAVQYDPLAFAYFGGVSRGGTVMMIRKDALARLGDRTARPVVVPGVEVASTGPLMALWGAEHLGWNVKFVIGYAGASAMMLAVRQGEADVLATSSALQIRPLLEDPNFIAYAQFGDLADDGTYVERDNYPGVPVFADIIMPKLPEDQRDIFITWLQTTQSVDKWFALPPNAAPEVIATYAAAFDKAMADPGFLKLAQAQLGEDFKPISGKTLALLVQNMVSKSEPMLGHMLKLRKKYGLPVD